jgi:periplasmic protein CpxP/Spy
MEKDMKRQIAGLTLFTLFGLGAALAAPQDSQSAAGAQAQSETTQHAGKQHQVDPNRQVQRLSKRLNLTADQQAQLLPILTDRQKQIVAIRSDNTLAAQDRREKLRAVMEDSNTKIKALLNDTQKQTFEQLEQQRRTRMQEQHSHKDSAAPAAGH